MRQKQIIPGKCVRTLVRDVRYTGTEAEWNEIQLNDGNECLFPIQFNARPGDVTGDGEVDVTDILRLMKYVAGDVVEVNTPCIDLTGDGKTDILDIIRMVRYLSGEKVTIC